MTALSLKTVLSLRLSRGGVIVAPNSLSSITTYVLLEQEEWFEKESGFLRRWLKPGMTVLDIGANLGIYSVPIAQLLGKEGRVFAFEPASEPRALLLRSKAVNRLDNLDVIGLALSDGEREGILSLGESSELNSLGGGEGEGEAVRITCLDAEDQRRGWAAPDFVKLDAEGEEAAILRGGRQFFARHSPLVMFEVKAGDRADESLRAAFPAMGYGVYRLLAGAPVLVPDDPTQPLDQYELNLFAAKPDRAAALAAEGLLVERTMRWRPDPAAHAQAVAAPAGQPFAASFASVFTDGVAIDAAYRDALAGYAFWRFSGAPVAERHGALDFACSTLEALCGKAPSFPRLSSFARIAWEAGRRTAAVSALTTFLDVARRGNVPVAEPFWPACPRYQGMSPGARAGEWFIAQAVEQLERLRAHSSLFGGCGPFLDWLCATPFASPEMERRRLLHAARSGQRVAVPERLRIFSADHVNADLWRSGRVPGCF